jgi:small subunit ribosomal protein S27Ae
MADKKPVARKGPVKGIWNTYEKKGDSAVKKNRWCPKCGAGFALAAHQGRLYCGSCHYTEFQKQK